MSIPLILVLWATSGSNILSNLLSDPGSNIFNAGVLVMFWVDFGSKGHSGIPVSSGVSFSLILCQIFSIQVNLLSSGQWR